MASLSPQLLQAVVKQLAKQAEDVKRIPEPSMAPVKEIEVPSKSLDKEFVEKLKQGVQEKTPLGRRGANTKPQRQSHIPEDVVDEFGRDATDLPQRLTPTKMTNNVEDFNAASALDNSADRLDPNTGYDAASAPLRADEVVNPNRQKAAGLDLEGEKIGMQMDKIQEIIDKDGFLRALGEDDLRDLMPDIISKNKSALNIKPDVQELSTNVFDKLNELKESAKSDKTLLQKVEVLRAMAAQANDRKDEKTLQLMLEQLTGTDAGLEGLARFGKGRPTVPDDPTSLPINVPSKDKTATMEQIMKAVTQELGIK